MRSYAGASKDGSVLIITLIICGLLGLATASSLMLVQHNYVLSMRSDAWNSALPVAEAGIEEAMAQLNQYADTTNSLSLWLTSASANGWDWDGSACHVRRNLNAAYYDATISQNASNVMLLSVGCADFSGCSICRTVQVNAAVGTNQDGVVCYGAQNWSEQ